MTSVPLSRGIETLIAGAAGALRARGWAVLEDFVPTSFAGALRAEAMALRTAGHFRPAGVGRGAAWRHDPELRSDEVCWIDTVAPTPDQRRLLDVVEQLRAELNARLLLGLFEYEAHLAVYPPGAFYRRHRDHFRGTEERRVTTTLYLNEDWSEEDGGRLRMYPPEGEPVEVAPEAGTLLLFLSQDVDHEVLPARRERWSWTGWFRQRTR